MRECLGKTRQFWKFDVFHGRSGRGRGEQGGAAYWLPFEETCTSTENTRAKPHVDLQARLTQVAMYEMANKCTKTCSHVLLQGGLHYLVYHSGEPRGPQ